MKFAKNFVLPIIAMSLSTILKAQEKVMPYNHKTDFDAAMAIFKANEKALSIDPKVNIQEVAKQMLLHSSCKPYVLRLNDKTIGCLLPAVGSGMAMIHMLAIDQQYQNKGYGTKFLREALKDLQNSHKVSKVTLTTGSGPDHIAARKLYEKSGFKKFDMAPFLSSLPEQQRKEILASLEKSVQYHLTFDANNQEKSDFKNDKVQ